MNHWKGARNTQQWITGCCTSLSNVIQAPTLADNERNQNWILAATGQIQKSHVVALFPLLSQIRIGPTFSPSKQQWAEHSAIWLSTVCNYIIPSLTVLSLLGFISISWMWSMCLTNLILKFCHQNPMLQNHLWPAAKCQTAALLILKWPRPLLIPEGYRGKYPCLTSSKRSVSINESRSDQAMAKCIPGTPEKSSDSTESLLLAFSVPQKVLLGRKVVY